MRVLFFGTPGFAVPTLERLVDAGHQIVAVITQPDRARGRGQQVTPGAVKTAAARRGLPVLQPGLLNDPSFLDQLKALGPDLGVAAAFGRLLPQVLLELPRLGLINVHASLLPRWRGAAPVHRAILAGDRETGVSIMRVVFELDAGPVLAAARIPIADEETSDTLERRLADLGAALLEQTVSGLSKGRVAETPQDPSAATYAHRLARHDSEVDWSRTALEIHNQIRGLHPWPLAAARLGGRRVQLLRSIVALESGQTGEPGTIVEITHDGIVTAAGAGAVRVLELRPEGRAAMPAGAFANGAHVAAGDRFTPMSERDS